MNPPLRIVFFGTADLACPSLVALAQEPGFELAAVVTQPDRPKGRDLKPQPSPVKREALARGLPVLQPERARHASFLEQLAQLSPDLIAVAAYGQILPAALLELPRFGCLNVHTSLLPKYRGAAPIQWAILNDEAETGVTIMKMDAGLDTGAILTQESTPIRPEDNAQSLHDRLAKIGAALLIRTIPDFIAGRIDPRSQPAEGASYARKITKEDGQLDWTQPARLLWNRVRAFTPWPGAFTFLPNTPKQPLVKVWRAEVAASNPENAKVPSPTDSGTLSAGMAEGRDEGSKGAPGEILQADRFGITVGCGDGALRILELQREGGRRLSPQEFLSGHPLRAGERLG